jgi:ferredoxin/nitrate reductase gamma subunit
MAGAMYSTMALALVIFAYGIWRRVKMWLIGRPEPRWDRLATRLVRVLVRAIAHTELVKERLPGLMHALLFFGFAVLFAATTVVFLHDSLGIPIMRGRFYLYFQSLTVNLFGILAIVGVAVAVCRRYIARPPALDGGRWPDAVVLLILLLLLVSGFAVSGLRIVATNDPLGWWRPGSAMAGWAIAAVVPESALRQTHAIGWVIHVALWHALLALIPFTKMFHLVASPLNVFLGNLGAKSSVTPIAFDDAASLGTLGIQTPLDMTWKQLLELDACTECGRCQVVCPAWLEEKPLSPKRVIIDIRDHVRNNAALLRSGSREQWRDPGTSNKDVMASLPPLPGGVIAEETLWACTTCRACEEACPVSIEHVRLIVQLRQNLAMEHAMVPEGVADVVKNLEVRYNPFPGVAVDRMAWSRKMLVRGQDRADGVGGET